MQENYLRQENCFSARELINALAAEGMRATVEQTGGGTATFYVDNSPEHAVMCIGPGAYDWTTPDNSRFTTDELSYALDYCDREGNFRGEDDPEQFDVAPGTPVPDIARQIAAKYRELNP